MLKKCCDTWMKNLNIGRFIIAQIVVFIWMMVAEMYIHHTCLMGLYKQTPQLWRPMEEMQGNIWWMVLGYLLLAKVFVYIFTRGYEGKGWCEGLRYGLLIGFFVGIMQAMSYIWLPISTQLAGGWFLASLAVFVPAGVLAALVYKPKA